jgi:hypothetical protein
MVCHLFQVYKKRLKIDAVIFSPGKVMAGKVAGEVLRRK